MSAVHTTLPSTPVGEPPFAVGEVIAGKYSIERVVGVGGMAIVFSAHHLELDQPVAIKVLLPAHASNPDLLRRFVTEARAAAKLKSVHVARISDVATIESKKMGMLPIIVMELLDGRDLAAVLEERGRLTTVQALNFVLQACDAVAEAHGLGIIHRDLKPANLYLTERRDGSPVVKLLDFGISKHTAAASGPSGARPIFGRALAKQTELVGTPAYMSPEQIEGRELDHRTDIWSLGVILHELLTGRDPFAAADTNETLDRILKTKPPSLVSIAPDVPPVVVEIVQRCLQKDRDKRYASVAELTAALNEALGEMSFVSGIGRVNPAALPAAAPAARAAAPTYVLPHKRARPANKVLLGLFVALAVSGLMLIGAWLALKRVEMRPAEASPAISASAAFPPAPPLPSEEPAPAVADPSVVDTATPISSTKPAARPPSHFVPKRVPSAAPSSSVRHRTPW